MSLRRGWIVTLKDGTEIQEGQMEWKEVPKIQIKTISLHYDGRQWLLPEGKDAYFVNTRASIIPGVAASLQIEKRTVGWYEGSEKVHYTIDERTGRFEIKVQ